MKRLRNLSAALGLSLGALGSSAALAASTGTYSEASVGALIYGWWGQQTVLVDCTHIPDGALSPCGDGARSANSGDNWNQVVELDVQASPALGALSGSASAYRQGTTSGGFDSRGTGGGALRSFWYDTFTVGSSTLPAGTPVELVFRVNLAVGQLLAPPEGGACSIGGSGGCAKALAVLHNGGADAGWLAYAESRTPFMDEGSGPVSSANPGLGSMMTVVGASLDLWGELNLRASVEARSGEMSFLASVMASAGFFVDVVTPGASVTAFSGHDYSINAAPVPEPASALLLLSGLLGLALRRRKAGP